MPNLYEKEYYLALEDFLYESLDVSNLEKIFGSENFDVKMIVSYLEKAAREETQNAFNQSFSLKHIFVQKFLSLLKKVPNLNNNLIYAFVSKMAFPLAVLSYLYNNKTLQNALPTTAKQVLDNYLKLNTVDALNDWAEQFKSVEPTIILNIKDKLYGDAPIKPIYTENGVEIYHLENYIQARKIGGDTEWCVSSSNRNMWNEYEETHSVYAIIFPPKSKENKYLVGLPKTKDDKQYGQIYVKLAYGDGVKLTNIKSGTYAFLKALKKYHDYPASLDNLDIGTLYYIFNPELTLKTPRNINFDELENLFLNEKIIKPDSKDILLSFIDIAKNINKSSFDFKKYIETAFAKLWLTSYKALINDSYAYHRANLINSFLLELIYKKTNREIMIDKLYYLAEEFNPEENDPSYYLEIKNYKDEDISPTIFIDKMLPYYKKALPQYENTWNLMEVFFKEKYKFIVNFFKNLESYGYLNVYYKVFDALRSNSLIRDFYRLNETYRLQNKLSIEHFRNLNIYKLIQIIPELKNTILELRKIIKDINDPQLIEFLKEEAEQGNYIFEIFYKILQEKEIEK